MFQHSTESSPLLTNTGCPQDKPNPRDSSESPFSESSESRPMTPEFFTYSSSNTSLESLSLPPTPHEQDGPLPVIQISTGHLDRPHRGIDADLVTPIAKRQRLGMTHTPASCQSPPPIAHNEPSLMPEDATSHPQLIRDESDPLPSPPNQEVPPTTQIPAPIPTSQPFAAFQPFAASQRFTSFLQTLDGHQLRVEPEADSDRLLISLGPFVISVLPIAPQ